MTSNTNDNLLFFVVLNPAPIILCCMKIFCLFDRSGTHEYMCLMSETIFDTTSPSTNTIIFKKGETWGATLMIPQNGKFKIDGIRLATICSIFH